MPRRSGRLFAPALFVPTHRKASSIRLPPGPLHGCLDRPGGCGTVLPGQQRGDLSGRLLHLRVEGGGGNTQSSVTQNDHLLGVVRGSHPHPVLLPAEGIGGLLNIGVRCLSLLGVHHIDVVIAGHLAHTPGTL